MCLLALLAGCRDQPPLPYEAAALAQELAVRLHMYRQAVPGFAAEGTAVLSDAEGKRSAADWRVSSQGGQDFTLQLYRPAEDEPLFTLRTGRDRVSVRLHAPGGREAVRYQADPADLEASLAEPRLAPLRLLLHTLKTLAAPAEFQVARAEFHRQSGELLVETRSRIGVAQLRLRREDARPLFIAATATNAAMPGCLEIVFPDKPAIEAEAAAGTPALHLPAEAVLTWLPCCTRQADGKLRIKLRAFRTGISSPPEMPAGRVLPLRELAGDRLWGEFLRRSEQDPGQSACPPQ